MSYDYRLAKHAKRQAAADLAYSQLGEADYDQRRRERAARAAKLASGRGPVNLKAERAGRDLAEAAANRASAPRLDVPAGIRIFQPAARMAHAPTCFNCGNECESDSFCHGCRAYICSACDVNFGLGRNHEPEDHLTPAPHQV
jgi:hypothetical protein